MEASREATLDLAWGSNLAFDLHFFIPLAKNYTSLHVCLKCLDDYARKCVSYTHQHLEHLRMKTPSCLSVIRASKTYVVCGSVMATS